MDALFKNKSSNEIERLMNKVSRERSRVIREFVKKAHALEVEEEFFQCYLACFPTVEELRKLLNEDQSSTMRFEIWSTVNGTMVKRTA
jgi:hypothetical protein